MLALPVSRIPCSMEVLCHCTQGFHGTVTQAYEPGCELSDIFLCLAPTNLWHSHDSPVSLDLRADKWGP